VAGDPQELYPAILARSMRDLGSSRRLGVSFTSVYDHVAAKRAGLPTVWIN
jgi:hypothetical protein